MAHTSLFMHARPTMTMSGVRQLGAFYVGVVLLASCAARLPALTQDSGNVEPGNAYQLGMTLLREKRYQNALQQFKSLERNSPQLPQGYTGEGITLALMGKLEESIKALNKALEIDPGFWVARRELGIIYWQANQKDQAARELRKMLALFPDDPPVNLILAQYEFERSDYARAAIYFGKAPVQLAADANLSLMAAEAQLKSGAKAQAREALEALATSPALNPQQRFHLAWLLGEADDYAKSIQVLESLPSDYADRFGRGYAIALAYYGEGQYANCVTTLDELKRSQMLWPDLFSLLGAAEEKSGNTLEAYNALREGIYAFPKDDQNYLNIAALSAEHLNYDLASQILTSGVALMPGDYKLYLACGVVHTLARRLERAQADYEKALALAPNEGEGYVALGICKEDENKYDEAAATFRRGIVQQPKNALLYYFLADSLLRGGISVGSPDYQEAVAAVESSVELNPEFAHAYLERARLESMRHQTDKAFADLEHGHLLAPDSREISYQLAVAYRNIGRTAEAEKLFNTVKEASEKDAEAFRTGQLKDVIVTMSKLPGKAQ
jgi:tetratricopeptide (TPR) repeat protein